MKALLAPLIALAFSSCALNGDFGPEAQARAQRSVDQMKQSWAQVGQSLDQLAQTGAQAAGAYAQGYAEAYNAYPQPEPDYTIHSALVTQIGQPPKIITYNQNSALITQIGQPPIIITGY